MPWNTPAHRFIHIHNSILSSKYMTIPFTWSSQRYARCYGLIITSTRPFWGALTVCLSADRLAAHARVDAEDQDAGETGRSPQSGAERVLKQHWKPHKRAPFGFSGSPCSAVLGAASCRFLRHSLVEEAGSDRNTQSSSCCCCCWSLLVEKCPIRVCPQCTQSVKPAIYFASIKRIINCLRHGLLTWHQLAPLGQIHKY